MNRQTKSLLISSAIHLGIACLVIAISSSFARLDKTVIIDFTLLDSKGSKSPGAENNAGYPPRDPATPKNAANRQKAFPRKIEPRTVDPTQPNPVPAPVTEPARTAPTAAPVQATAQSNASSPSVSTPVTSGKEGSNGSSGSGRAGGSGGSGSGHGQAASGTGTGNSADQLRKRYLAAQFEYIKKLIEKNIKYPARALRMGWSGKILVSFTILENGRVTNTKILSSSGYDLLDENLLDTIKTVEPFPKPPVSAQLKIPIIYRLEQ